MNKEKILKILAAVAVAAAIICLATSIYFARHQKEVIINLQPVGNLNTTPSLGIFDKKL